MEKSHLKKSFIHRRNFGCGKGGQMPVFLLSKNIFLATDLWRGKKFGVIVGGKGCVYIN